MQMNYISFKKLCVFNKKDVILQTEIICSYEKNRMF